MNLAWSVPAPVLHVDYLGGHGKPVMDDFLCGAPALPPVQPPAGPWFSSAAPAPA